MHTAQELLGNKVREARDNRELTQRQLAEALSMGLRTVNEIEQGRSNLKFESLINVARFLDITIDDAISPDRIAPDSEEAQILRELSACSEHDRRIILAAVRAMLNAARNSEL